MDFRDWEPDYERILQDFGFSRGEDERAAEVLAALSSSKLQCDDVCLSGLFGHCATIVAGPPMTDGHISSMIKGAVLSVGIGTSLLMREAIIPDLVVTDLDGDVDTDMEANRKGAVLVVHAHGDNVPALRRYVPQITGRMVPTTQSVPFGQVRDFGGFTDGDRAVALAAHFGVRELRLIGFDLRNPRPKIGTSPAIKAKKLRWAQRLIDLIAAKGDIAVTYH